MPPRHLHEIFFLVVVSSDFGSSGEDRREERGQTLVSCTLCVTAISGGIILDVSNSSGLL